MSKNKTDSLVTAAISVTNLNRYPIKSLKGEELEGANIKTTGIEYDRHWMLVDDKGKFITQRKHPQLALLSAWIEGDTLNLKIPGQEKIISKIKPQANNDSMKVSIWNDELIAKTVEPSIDDLLSEYLNKKCQLIVMDHQQPRIISDEAAEGTVSFADAFPFLLIGSESLSTLNGKLKTPVSKQNFRPNIVVNTHRAHEEDSWDEVKIGEVRFKNVKLCSRCILTTVDPETGVRSVEQEPLVTLLTYRNIEQKIMFGINLIALNEGVIRKSDEVEVLSYL
ncbi:MAG: hypothetical protein ACI9N9_001651 [Enterobacterales bacterium]|jgi:uncharacterized protein YcbX